MLLGVFSHTGSSRILRKLARLEEDQHLSFVRVGDFPELVTISIDPRQFNGDFLQAKFDDQTCRLTLKLPEQDVVTFILREDDAMILAKSRFDVQEFRKEVQKALRTQSIANYQQAIQLKRFGTNA